MQSVIRSIFILFLLGYFTIASAQLPPEIRADAYLLQAEQAIRNGDLHRAQAAIQNILRLQKEHELDLSDEFHFRYAKSADAVDLSDQALESVLKYLVASGREGQHYVEALALMNKVQDRSSGDVVASQLSPNIITDAHLLQAEQAIRDGDLDRARTVIQNIRNLQEQHELVLPDEFHFRYAKAADVLDMPDQALEAILKYLAVSGREGQHYLEALALMNKVQTAVSCKGWDTEDYFKTATLEEVTACLNAGVDLNERNDAGTTPLHRAAKNTENPDVIKALLDAGADLEARDNDKRTSLHWAAGHNKNPDVVKILLHAGADIEAAQNKNKHTPLYYAVFFKRPAAIKILIEAGANIEAQSKNEHTPLSYAVFFKRPAAIKVLIEAGANTRVKDKWTSLHWAATYNENPIAIKALLNAGADPKAKDGDKQTPLHIATQFENLVAIKALLNAGADPKTKDDDKQTPLHYAARYSKNPEIVKTLLNAGADLKARDEDKWTPLHFAAWNNPNPEIVKTLFEAETDYKDREKNRWALLHHAAKYNRNPEAVKALIEGGIDPEAQDPSVKQTPLHRAVYNENPDILKVLLDAGADPKARDRFGRTPLRGAAYNKNPEIVKILLNAGADPNRQRFLGNAPLPLHLAAQNNENPAIVQVLIDAGANLEAQAYGKSTPLHLAVEYNDNPEVVKVLVNAGANLEVQTYYHDSTPLHLAAEHNENPDVVRILLSAGANLNAENKKGFTPLGLAVENNDNPEVVRVLRAAGASQTKIAEKSQDGDGIGKAAIALLGGAAIGYAGGGSEESIEAARQFMEGVLTEQPGGSGNTNSAATPSQTQGGQAQDPMQQALQNLENVCGEKYQGNFADNDHYRFYCMAAFNDYCALKRAKSDEAISKLRASLQQNCAVLKSVGADSKCSYCK